MNEIKRIFAKIALWLPLTEEERNLLRIYRLLGGKVNG